MAGTLWTWGRCSWLAGRAGRMPAALLLLLWTAAIPAEARDAEEEVARFGFAPEQVGYMVVDLATGEQLAGGRVNDLFIPASTAKVPTMVAALGILGPDYAPRTEVWGNGTVVDGVYKGDIYLRGLGDPFLDTDDLKGLVSQLSALGITAVDGYFVFDPGWLPQTATVTPTQPVTAGYNPGLAALSVNFNRVHLEWTPAAEGAAGGIDADVYVYANTGRVPVDWIEIANGGSFGALLDYGSDDGGQEGWVHADSLTGEGGVWLPVRRPAYHTAMLFRQLAADKGIALAEPVELPTPANLSLLALQTGAALPVAVSQILEHSNNMAAELVGMAAARQEAGAALGGLSDATAATGRWLQRHIEADWTGYAMENHSGLSSSSRMSPAQMCAILAYADGMDGPAFYDLLAPRWEGGVEGATVRAKTGTMAYGVGLAGYMVTKAGRRLAFAIFVSDIAARDALDAVLDLRDSSTPPAAKSWLNRARELERALVAGWARDY